MLKQFVQAQQSARQRKLYNNIAEILFEERGNEADELVQALKEKYDAIKMKLYEEALRMYVYCSVSPIFYISFLYKFVSRLLLG